MDQRFDGIDQRLDGMDQRFDGIDQRLDGMDQRFDGMDQRFDGVDQKFDGVDQRFDSLERDVKAIHGITRRQQTDFQNFRGNFAESAARKQAGFIAGEVGKFVGKRLLPNRRLTPNDLMAMAAAANDLSHISDNRLLSFYSADVVIEMHDRLHPAEVCYVAIEASYTCDPSDIARAIDHATLLREFTRKDAYPAVAGVRINEAARDSVNGGGEEPVLWYELEEEALDI